MEEDAAHVDESKGSEQPQSSCSLSSKTSDQKQSENRAASAANAGENRRNVVQQRQSAQASIDLSKVNLEKVLMLAEESQSRERKALESLQVARTRILEERKRAEQLLHERERRTKAALEQEQASLTSKSEELVARESILKTENNRLQSRLHDSEIRCARLREQLANALGGASESQSAWQERVNKLETGVKALIESTIEAIDPFDDTFDDDTDEDDYSSQEEDSGGDPDNDGGSKSGPTLSKSEKRRVSAGAIASLKENSDRVVALREIGRQRKQYCQACLAKSDELDSVRSQLGKARTALAQARTESTFMAEKFEQEKADMRSALASAVAKYRQLVADTDEVHSSAEEMAASKIAESKQRAQKLIEDHARHSDAQAALLEASEENYAQQVRESTAAAGILRTMLTQEQEEAVRARSRAQVEREELHSKINHLQSQLDGSRQLAEMEASRFEREKTQLLFKLASCETMLEQAEKERTYVGAKFAALQASDGDDMRDLVKLWRRRIGLVDAALGPPGVSGVVSSPRSAAIEAKLAQDQENYLLDTLKHEVRTLREASESQESQIKAMQKDKMWLKAERDAVQEGYYRQQACLQDQLKVVNSLRRCLELAQDEHTAMMKANIESFDDIKSGLVQGAKDLKLARVRR